MHIYIPVYFSQVYAHDLYALSRTLLTMNSAETNFTSKGPNRAMSFDSQYRQRGKAATLTCHDVNYVVKTKKEEKKVLWNVYGQFGQGMNAILGPTGSGKSSLLDVLACRKDPKNLSGHVLVDGQRQPKNWKLTTGYVVQDDVVMGTLTVEENLMFSASLRLPSTMTRQQKQERVDNVVDELGLTDCKDTKVGTEFIRGVSGGERKRTNIGMELIISPPVLFLDEPTTGLDANTASTVMLILAGLAKRNRSIIFSIHQPRYSIYKLFDNMMLLSMGEVVYHGPMEFALEYFARLGYICEEHNNPSDFFLDVINGEEQKMNDIGSKRSTLKRMESGEISARDIARKQSESRTVSEQLIDTYKNSSQYKDLRKNTDPVLSTYKQVGKVEVKDEKLHYATSFLQQFLMISKRNFLNIIRNPMTSVVQMLMMIVFGTIVGLIYLQLDTDLQSGYQNRIGAFFFIVMNLVFGNMDSIELFIKERHIFIHENISGFYPASSYFMAKLFCDVIPMRVIPTCIFAVISYWMIGFQSDAGKFFFYTLALVFTSLAGSGVAFAMSATTGVFALANLGIALVYVIMMVFSGLLVNLGTMADWLSWLKYTSIFYFSQNALCINEFKDLEFCGNTTFPGASSIINPESTDPADLPIPWICTPGEYYLQQLDIDYETNWDLWKNVFALGAMFLGLWIIAYVQLRRIKKLK